VLEAGLALIALGCLGGVAALVFGRTVGTLGRSAARHLPVPGSVAAERHHHTGAVSAR